MSNVTVNGRAGAPDNRGAVFGLVIILLLAACGAGYYFYTRPKPTVVVQRDIDGKIVSAGTITAPATAQAVVFAPYAAPVQKVDKNLGAWVKRGEPIAELSAPE